MATNFKAWWQRFTHGEKYVGLAIGAFAFLWCFTWAIVAWLSPEPRSESVFYLVAFWLGFIGALVGAFGLVLHAAHTMSK